MNLPCHWPREHLEIHLFMHYAYAPAHNHLWYAWSSHKYWSRLVMWTTAYCTKQTGFVELIARNLIGDKWRHWNTAEDYVCMIQSLLSSVTLHYDTIHVHTIILILEGVHYILNSCTSYILLCCHFSFQFFVTTITNIILPLNECFYAL